MAESAAAAASLNAVFKLIEFSHAYREVSGDVQGLLKNIEIVDRKIRATKQLRRVKSAWMSRDLKDEVDSDIQAAEQTVHSIGQTIERCRVDLETNNQSVKPMSRMRWLMRDGAAFGSRSSTLSTCLAALNSDITRLDGILPFPVIIEPPSYEDVTRRRGSLHSPLQRRRLAREKSVSSLNTMSESTHSAVETSSTCPSPFQPDPQIMQDTVKTQKIGLDIAELQYDGEIDEARLHTPLPSIVSWSNEPWRPRYFSDEKIPVAEESPAAPSGRPKRMRSACIR